MASEERDQLLAHLRRLQLRHATHRIDDLLREAAQLQLGHLGFLARVVECRPSARLTQLYSVEVTLTRNSIWNRILK